LRGTPEGDAKVGTCPQCQTDIARGDKFVVNVGGPVIHVGCVVDWVIARRRARREPIFDDKFPGTPEEEAAENGTIYDGEFPI